MRQRQIRQRRRHVLKMGKRLLSDLTTDFLQLRQNKINRIGPWQSMQERASRGLNTYKWEPTQLVPAAAGRVVELVQSINEERNALAMVTHQRHERITT